MTQPDFFTIPRSTKPADFFERILPALPLRLPPISLDPWVYHVQGAGGGVWSIAIEQGKVVVTRGEAQKPAGHTVTTSAALREAVAGALRDRLAQVLQKQGRPLQIPDLTGLPLDPARARALAQVGGSLAIEIGDRTFGDRYRFVVTLGPGPAAWEQATTTLEVDADDLAALAATRTPPMKVLVSGKLRIKGDADLPARALAAVLGK